MSVIANITSFPSEVIYIGGGLMTVFLTIYLLISLLLSDTKYWDKYVSGTLDICHNPLLLTFTAILIFRIILIIW